MTKSYIGRTLLLTRLAPSILCTVPLLLLHYASSANHEDDDDDDVDDGPKLLRGKMN